MISLNLIQEFLGPKKMAIAGVSRDPKKFGAQVFKELKSRGFELVPVNPNADELYGVKCYHSVNELPDDLTRLYIVTPKSETADVVKQAAERGIPMIWIQQSADTPEAIEIAKQNNMELIYKKCIFMFAEPVESVHKFHRFCMKLFNAYPKLEKAG